MVATSMTAKAGKAADGARQTVTWKVKRSIAEKLSQIAALRGLEKQDVLDEYERQFEDDLLRLITKRQAELKRGKAGE
jgi:hypothetical protein